MSVSIAGSWKEIVFKVHYNAKMVGNLWNHSLYNHIFHKETMKLKAGKTSKKFPVLSAGTYPHTAVQPAGEKEIAGRAKRKTSPQKLFNYSFLDSSAMSTLHEFIPFRDLTCLFIVDWPRTCTGGRQRKEGEMRERFQHNFFTYGCHGLRKPALLASSGGLFKSPKYLVVQQALKWHITDRSGCSCGVTLSWIKPRGFLTPLTSSRSKQFLCTWNCTLEIIQLRIFYEFCDSIRPMLHVPRDVYPPKCTKFNVPVCLNVQFYEQTKLQAVPVLLQDMIRQNRLAQESCSQSIWKYDCPSMTNQGLSKANSWTIAQAQAGKKKHPNSSMLKWKRGSA